MKLSKCAVLLFCLSAMASLSPAQISISGELDAGTYTYSTGYENISESTFSVGDLGNFSYQFSSAGDTTMTVTWSAPEGQVFVVNAPENWGTATLNMSYTGGPTYSSTGNFNDRTNTPIFTDLTGSFDSVTSYVLLSGPSVADDSARFTFTIDTTIGAGSSISFSSVSLTAVVDSSYAGDFSSSPVTTFNMKARVDSYYPVSGGDPGQWASLSAVPEPSTYAALLGGIALVITAGQRRRRN